MKKLLALVMAAMLLVACFAGCSAKTDNPAADQTDTTAAAPSDTGSADVADTTGTADNTAKGTIVVGYTIYEPMNYFDDNNNLVGFDTELAEAVFGKMGYEVMFQEIDWTQKYTDLNSGTIDCIWNGFTCNTSDDDGVARADKVDFSYNYMENQQVVIVKAGSAVKTVDDMKGKFAAVEGGSAGESYVTGIDEGIVLTKCLKQTDCLTEVLSENVDYAVVDVQLAKAYVGKGDYADLEIVEGLESDLEYYAIGFKKGSELTANVNAQLEALAADGTIAALAEKYGVANSAVTDFSSQK